MTMVVRPLPIETKPGQAKWVGPIVGVIVFVVLYFGTNWLVSVIAAIATVVAVGSTIFSPQIEGQFASKMTELSITLGDDGLVTYADPLRGPRVIARAGEGRVRRVQYFGQFGSRGDSSEPLIHQIWIDGSGTSQLRMAEGAWPVHELEALQRAAHLTVSPLEKPLGGFGGRRRKAPPTGGTGGSGPTLPGIPNG